MNAVLYIAGLLPVFLNPQPAEGADPVSPSDLDAGSGEVAEPESFHCGEAACFVLLRRLGGDVSFNDVCAQFSSRTGDTSFRDLQHALRLRGVETVGLRASIDRLKALSFPCIVQVQDSAGHFKHFHVAETRDNKLFVLDPLLSAPVYLTPEQEASYSKFYSGMALVLTDELTWQERYGREVAVVFLATVALLIGIATWVLLRRVEVPHEALIVQEEVALKRIP